MTQADVTGGRYRESGVDIDAGNAFVQRIKPLAASTRRAGCDARLGGFGALFDLKAAGFRDPLLVSTTDGVGTKLVLAEQTDRHEGIGIDLVAMCVNDLVVQGAEPLLFLDYFATGRLSVEHGVKLVEGIAEGCRQAGCVLVGGETAEMPGLYQPGQYDLAGFAVGAVERAEVLPRPDVGPGDVILGLGASGVHSNGFSLVRLIVKETGADLSSAAPFANAKSLGEALLTPTRIYVRSCLAAIRAGGVKALAHITGGGLIENPPRVLPDGTIAKLDARAWPLPPIFRWLKREGRLNAHDLARTFNAGIGMILVVEAARADALISLLQAEGEVVHRIGTVEAGQGPASVTIDGIDEAWG